MWSRFARCHRSTLPSLTRNTVSVIRPSPLLLTLPSLLSPNFNNVKIHFLSVIRLYSAKPSVPCTDLLMPALSPSMEVGKIVKWNKKEGEVITAGDTIAEIETDKATVAYEALDDGILAKILLNENTSNIRVGTAIGIIVTDPSNVALFKDYSPSGESSAPSPSQSTDTITASSPSPAAPASTSGGTPPPTLLMPALSPTMEQGKIVKWSKSEGDKIDAGDSIAEIETDKATLSLDGDDGYLAKILVQPGTLIKVGAPIAIVVTDKSEIEKYKNYTLDKVTQSSPPASTPAPTPKTSEQPETKPTPSPTPAATPSVPSPSASAAPGSRIVASPLARVAAAQKGIDLSKVRGTGPNNRIIRADIDEYTAPAVTTTEQQPKTQVTGTTVTAPEYTDITNSNIRKITAERLTLSKQTIPHYYLTVEIVVDKLLKLREELNGFGSGKNENFKLSVNDFVIKAAAVALRAVPEVNSEWRGDFIRRYHNVHINVAVNTPRGLLTPIVRDVDKMGLKTINSEVKAKATRAQEGKITPDDLSLGTFTISNLGMFGISQFTAVISPPQVAILAVGTTKKVPVLLEEQQGETPKVKVANILTVTLSCDHRVVDGAVGAQWLQVFKDVMENPIKFLL